MYIIFIKVVSKNLNFYRILNLNTNSLLSYFISFIFILCFKNNVEQYFFYFKIFNFFHEFFNLFQLNLYFLY